MLLNFWENHSLCFFQVQESAREKYETAIKSLQDKINKLENQCQQHALKQQELTEELTQLRAEKANKAHNIRSTEIQTGNSLEFAPSSTSSPNKSPRQSPVHVNQSSPAITPSHSRKSPASTKGRSPANTTPSPSHNVLVLNKVASKNSPSTPGKTGKCTVLLHVLQFGLAVKTVIV